MPGDLEEWLKGGSLSHEGLTEFISGVHDKLDKGFSHEILDLRSVDGKSSYSFFADAVDSDAGCRILDLGCADGGLIPFLRFRSYTGLDVSAAEIDRAKMTYERRSDVSFFRSPVGQYKTEERFERIVAHLSLPLMVPLESLANNIGDWLAPGGRFVYNLPVAPAVPTEFHDVSLLIREFVKARYPGGLQLGDARPLDQKAMAGLFQTHANLDVSIVSEDYGFTVNISAQQAYETFTNKYLLQALPSPDRGELNQAIRAKINEIFAGRDTVPFSMNYRVFTCRFGQ